MKIIRLIMFLVLMAGVAATVSCDEMDPCERAEEKCRECCTIGGGLVECLAIIEVCKEAFSDAPRLRRECCINQINDINCN